MTKRFAIKRLFHFMFVGGALALSNNAMASAFQLWEQDGASVGNYHAGRAAEANDASTAYYNPAGMVRLNNQQIVLGDVGIMTDIRYRGNVGVGLNVPPLGVFPVGPVTSANAQGGSFSQVPDIHYVAPINQRFAFGISVVGPFGLKTNYGRDTTLRYAATLSQLQVIDVSPALAFAITPQFSIGAGLDAQRMSAEFDQVATIATGTDTNSTTKGWNTAYGYHVGVLFQYKPTTRFGLTYNSSVEHTIGGTSKFVGPIANFATEISGDGPKPIVSNNARARLKLPAFATFSAFHQVNSQWAIMGTAIYTQWNVFKNLTITDAAAANSDLTFFGPQPVPSTTTTVVLPTHYKNTLNLSVGANYYATEKFMIRWGVGYDQTPVQNNYREVRVPDNNRYAIAFGGHYQATKTLGFDLGYTHLFMAGTAEVHPPALATGAQVVTTNGNVKASADVFGAQLTWDLV